jgi:cyanobactin biosynthesis protein (PatB/AcyB/McaB family)
MPRLFPVLAPPVFRPSVVEPSSTIDVVHGEQYDLLSVYLHLTHGANYNDPSPWASNALARGDSR